MRILIAIAAAALAVVLVAAGPSPTPSPAASPMPDALTILRSAEQVARANPDPPYIVYDMHEIFIHHGHQFTYDYHVWYRTSDGKGLMQNAVGDRAGHHEQHFGYPFPSAPDNNILLYATPPPTPMPVVIASPSPGGPGQTPATLIGVMAVTANRFYSVTLVGLEDYQGHSVYHLALLPQPDVSEKDHPWKDLWVDTQTFEVWKAHALASGTIGPMTGQIEATAEFEPVNGYWLIAHATGNGGGHVAFISDSGQYEYYFSGFDFPNTLPDWYFDPDLFRHH